MNAHQAKQLHHVESASVYLRLAATELEVIDHVSRVVNVVAPKRSDAMRLLLGKGWERWLLGDTSPARPMSLLDERAEATREVDP